MSEKRHSVGPEHLFRDLDLRTDSLLSGQGRQRTDALTDLGAGAYFQKELEHIFPEVLKADLPVLNAERLFAVDRTVPQGAETFTHRLLEHTGKAAVISNWGQSLPQVGLGRSEWSSPLKSVGDAYGWSEQDLAAASFTGLALNSELGISARRAVEESLNDIAWNGIPELSIPGILTFPYVPRYTTSVAITGTVDTVLDQLHAAVARVPENTGEVHKPNRLILAPRSRRVLGRKLRTNTDSSILKMFRENDPYITIFEEAAELQGVGPNGEDAFIVDRADGAEGSSKSIPQNCKIVISQPFTQLPVQQKDLMYLVNCLARTGGCTMGKPLGTLIGYWHA